ncbi:MULTISPECIES: hypothetical protein [unclassified Acinetobacter]|uniref:hypothetical protein n=1 Tax=unclassified Acinetobacter TaxID=196816 RepID=UPI001F4B002C|nr:MULTISPECIES: hypothetical protein [unclassified Acinetobacter]MCH7352243.1 hypothetical protein [Acinetobacter sp. NIPH 2023]MCH7358210.1 hypothetical protein [Acinetobacter sp. NIPH 2024]
MKIQTSLFLLLFTFLTCSTDIYAASKPSPKPTIWEIVEATPKKTNILDDVVDATNLNDVVEATGRKLDYDRTPVDNKVYKARVNPRIPETKAAIGSNAMKKLLKVSGWGYAAVEGVKLLLEGIDWVMDPANQSIWRYKDSTPGDYSCSAGFLWRYQDDWKPCPIEAINQTLRKWELQQNNTIRLEFVKYDVPNIFEAARKKERITFTIQQTTLSNGYKSTTPNQALSYKPDPNYKPTEKEYLTEDQLSDYMLGKHKDFKDDKYKSRLPKENTWTGVAQQFKPENKFEEENSPTFKIAQKELDQSNPESEDTNVKPTEPDPNTGEKGFSLPPFCSWATTVCDFIKWFKEEPEKDDNDQPEVDDKGIFSRKFDTVFSLSKQCPSDIPVKLESKFLTGTFTFSMKWLCIIFTFLGYPLVFASHCVGVWILYETVTRKQIKW